MFAWIKKTFWTMVAWFKPESAYHATPPPTTITRLTAANLEVVVPIIESPSLGRIDPATALLAADIIPPPVPVVPHRRAKWVKPKGALPPKPERKERDPSAPKVERKPKVKLPEVMAEDPEQWGQYYFRDSILDQLDIYFKYLHRMKRNARDAYDLHRQIGIQIMPRSAVQTFDNWRSEGQVEELSAWFNKHRPAFGAVAYGIDKPTQKDEVKYVDAPPEFFERQQKKYGDVREQQTFHRIATVTGSASKIDVGGGVKQNPGVIWIPKFLYFCKLKRVPHTIQVVKNADIYVMTVYWDRLTGFSKGWHKRHKGGIPQEYALCVDRDTNAIKLLRQQIVETIRVKSRHSSDGYVKIPNKYWAVATDYHLAWAFGRDDASPEHYLIRCFVEAALMYENAAQGSMVRIEVHKGELVATFGVDIKRMSYFFKDRDITLTPKGKRARIFHIVRPHIRHTKKGEIGVKLTFRGIKQFTWAGYKVSITVPGLDHFSIAEIDIACNLYGEGEKTPKDGISQGKFGEMLTQYIREGRGAWRAKETSR
jgi:hypothetical protein